MKVMENEGGIKGNATARRGQEVEMTGNQEEKGNEGMPQKGT